LAIEVLPPDDRGDRTKLRLGRSAANLHAARV
jgi:hypothetical protein